MANALYIRGLIEKGKYKIENASLFYIIKLTCESFIKQKQNVTGFLKYLFNVYKELPDINIL